MRRILKINKNYIFFLQMYNYIALLTDIKILFGKFNTLIWKLFEEKKKREFFHESKL